MSKNLTLTRSVLFACALASPATAWAQSSRVFVSARTGSDANTCNNIGTPCQTLQGAVNQVAAGGAVLVLDTGGYGPLNINKAVSIEAPPGIEAFIHPPSGAAITILAGAGDVVVLRGLTLSVGPSYGIDFITGAALHVERCVIQGFQTGIVASRASGTTQLDLFVEDTVVRNCSFDGIAVLALNGVVRATIDGCTIEGNGSLGLSTSADFGSSCISRTVARKTFAAGNGVGFSASSYGAGRVGDMALDGCTAANNSTRGMQGDSFPGGTATLRFARSTVTGNGGSASVVWGGVGQFAPAVCLSRQDNTVEGNSVNLIGTIGSYSQR
jgi:hypothetical protein